MGVGKKVRLRHQVTGGYHNYAVTIPIRIIEALGWRPKDRLDVALDTKRRAIIIRKAEVKE